MMPIEHARALIAQQAQMHNQSSVTMAETDPAQTTQMIVPHVNLQAPQSPYLTKEQYNQLSPEE